MDKLKSDSTDFVRDVIICGAMTFLCIPKQNRIMRIIEDSVKSGCNIRLSNKGTTLVFGSVSQYQAPMEMEIAAVTNTTGMKGGFREELEEIRSRKGDSLRNRSVEGCKQAITSVRRRSNALRSGKEESEVISLCFDQN